MTASWVRPTDGAGTWGPSRSHDTPWSLLAGFIACLVGVSLFIGLIVAGRAGMCAAYSGRTDGPSYCQEAAK